MTKGRPATRGIDDAVAIARTRGCTMRVLYGLESICDIMIRTATHIVLIKTRRMDRITATVAEIGHACRGPIGELRLFPQSEQIVLELWIYNKHGTYRFFRISPAGLCEIGRDGMPVAGAGEPANLAGQKEPAAAPVPAEQLDAGLGTVPPERKPPVTARTGTSPTTACGGHPPVPAGRNGISAGTGGIPNHEEGICSRR